jgi:hypothetical protein
MHTVADQIRQAADRGGDDGLPGGHELHRGKRHPLEMRGQDGNIERLDEIGDIVRRPGTEQRDCLADAELVDQRFERWSFRPFAEDQHPHSRHGRGEPRRGPHEHVERLLRP